MNNPTDSGFFWRDTQASRLAALMRTYSNLDALEQRLRAENLLANPAVRLGLIYARAWRRVYGKENHAKDNNDD